MPLGFEADAWLYAAAVAFVLGHLTVLVYLVRRSVGPDDRASGEHPRRGVDASADAAGPGAPDARDPGELPPVEGEDVVRCPNCSVPNEATFRFCRYCVGELTGGTVVSDAGGASRDGQVF